MPSDGRLSICDSHREYTLIDKATAQTLLASIRSVKLRVRDDKDQGIREVAFDDVPLGAPAVWLCNVRYENVN